MVDVIEMLVPAALHFGQERPSSPGVAGIHICVKVAAQTADYLGLVENALNRNTRKKNRRLIIIIITRFTCSLTEALKQLWVWTPTHGFSVILNDWISSQAKVGHSSLRSLNCMQLKI